MLGWAICRTKLLTGFETEAGGRRGFPRGSVGRVWTANCWLKQHHGLGAIIVLARVGAE